MLWLFGQIWLWLLISFALGCGVTWLMTRGERRAQAAPEPAPAGEPEPEPEPAIPVYTEPEPLSAEQTQFIPPARIQDDDEPFDQVAEGHREGQLIPEPVHPARIYHSDEPEPAARNGEYGHEAEPVWPSDEDWPPGGRRSEHRPGQGG
ncbi:hypothetical protein [Amycolatopsis sp. NPDC051071]|uniref:hypothetical protein n=1 Tax=Amycolatopsis sp. NPDC051071 TaxID=3154637 RepID=UPI003421440C